MFVRGFGLGNESKRDDISFYRGIVVGNNDPLQMNRVKVYIPELSNQPLDEWFDKYDEIKIKFPGKNLDDESWKDMEIFKEIVEKLPWAEIMYPVVGESSNGRFFSSSEQTTITDANYDDGVYKKSPDIMEGSFSPAYLYDNYDTMIHDSTIDPVPTSSFKNNPYSYSYRPNKMVNQVKGLMGIPEIGSKVWVTHNMGDLNFPVVVGVMHDHRSLRLINENNNYPRSSENI
jgi:hypothetical protein